jgi:predicted RNA-binding Zn-ribbon protein involved in translation (DUF1610 family)
MEKYAVEIKEEDTKEKTANKRNLSCSFCGSKLEIESNVPKCPKCGTSPWEATKINN